MTRSQGHYRRAIRGFKHADRSVYIASKRDRHISSQRINGDALCAFHRVIASADFPIGCRFGRPRVGREAKDAISRIVVVEPELNRINLVATINGQVVWGQTQIRTGSNGGSIKAVAGRRWNVGDRAGRAGS